MMSCGHVLACRCCLVFMSCLLGLSTCLILSDLVLNAKTTSTSNSRRGHSPKKKVCLLYSGNCLYKDRFVFSCVAHLCAVLPGKYRSTAGSTAQKLILHSGCLPCFLYIYKTELDPLTVWSQNRDVLVDQRLTLRSVSKGQRGAGSISVRTMLMTFFLFFFCWIFCRINRFFRTRASQRSLDSVTGNFF